MKVDTSIRPLAVPGDWQWSQAVDHWWCGVCGIWGRCDDNDRCDRIALLHGSIPCPSQGRPGLPRPALLPGHRVPGMKACRQRLSTRVRGPRTSLPRLWPLIVTRVDARLVSVDAHGSWG